MFSRTEFSASNFCLIFQPLKGFLSPIKKKVFWSTGNKTSVSKNSSNLPNIYLHTLSTTAHHSPLEHPIMVILLQAQSRTSSVDTQPKTVDMFLEDSVGTVTDFQSNTKSIRNSKSLTRGKSWKWVLPSTTTNAEKSWWNTRRSGKVSSEDSEDGLISKMIIKLWISSLWSQSGTYSSNFSQKVLSIEEEKSCLIQMVAQQSCQTLKFNWITRKSVTLHFTSVSHWFKTITLNSWSGPLLHGHCHQTWLWPSSQKWITLRSKIPKEMKSSLWQNAEPKLSMERTKKPLKFLTSSKERIWKEKSMFQCSTSSLIERKTDASRSLLLTSSPMIQVQVLYIVLLDSVKRIIRFVSLKTSLIPMIHQSQLIKTVNSPNNAQFMKEFMSRTQTKLLSKTSRKEAELFKVVLKSTTILTAGEVILLWFIKPSQHGSSKWLISKKTSLKTTTRPNGFQR